MTNKLGKVVMGIIPNNWIRACARSTNSTPTKNRAYRIKIQEKETRGDYLADGGNTEGLGVMERCVRD